jgi:hypothetical protein
MLQANQATVAWDSKKKHWHITVEVGAESIKRWNATNGSDAGDDALRAMAVEIARDEGYELEVQRVSIVR